MRVNFLIFMQIPLLPLIAVQCSPSLSDTWQVFGPFQIGTREAEWGADPLERIGGFRNLTYDPDFTFPSALPLNGTAIWNTTQLAQQDSPANETKGAISFGFSNVDWEWHRSIYGWSGIQFQAWARGTLSLCEDTRVTVAVSGVGEYWIDSTQYYGGDFFSYGRAPAVVSLKAGEHRIDVRGTGDIRAIGGAMPPMLSFIVDVKKAAGTLVAVPEGMVVMDNVAGTLAGMVVSVPVRNEGDEDTSIVVKGVRGKDKSTSFTMNPTSVKVYPGQTRLVKLKVESSVNVTTLDFDLEYEDDWTTTGSVSVSKVLTYVTNSFSPQKYTYLHPSGSVSYAVIRPPSSDAACSPTADTKAPILLYLHGAGVEADSAANRASYDALPDLCAFVLYAQGGTSWSGDDWHVWGFVDVEAGIAAIPDWMERVSWNRQGVDQNRWVVSGHSNGGQGAWYALTHRSDKIIAAAPLSGYLSIPAYVPYHLWHEAEPARSAIVLAGLNTYKHELLVRNMVGTPILQQHGQLDDNVPTYHSRRMRQLLAEAEWSSEYWEIAGYGHWWEGVMTWGGLPDFLTYHLNVAPFVSDLAAGFSVVVANPADMGARGGIKVDQLDMSERIGRIDVEIGDGVWTLTTSNVRRWHFESQRSNGTAFPASIKIDGVSMELSVDATYVLGVEGSWKTESGTDWQDSQRSGRQWGALDAILNSHGPFGIVLAPFSEQYHAEVALDIARNLYQYFAADSEIFIDAYDIPNNFTGNLILLGSPDMFDLADSIPITFSPDGVAVTDAYGRTRRYPIQAGLGTVLLGPLPAKRLFLSLWGPDELGLRTAARLLPHRTGVSAPDVIVLGKEARWQGVGGTRALGMWTSDWELSAGSYL